MTQILRKSASAIVLSGLAGLAIVAALAARQAVTGRSQSGTGKSPAAVEPVPALTPYIEAHTHFDERDPDGTIRAALAALKVQNASKIIFQMLPDTFDHPGHYDAEVLLPALKPYPDKLAIVGGGGTLNAMIQQSVSSGDAGPEIQRKFKARADELIKEGVVGFGEFSAEHFDGATPYQYSPADHPLFLLLADIAAQHGVPIDIHMEAVTKPMPTPPEQKSPPNPPQLHENITAFERLLTHNPLAHIIWAHAGTDFTGDRTPDLCRRLLQAHPNLYMEIKSDPQHPGKNYALAADGTIKPDWFKLFTDFPDRFILGTDQHYPQPTNANDRWQTDVLLFNQLPVDVRKKIGTENVMHLYFSTRAMAPTGSAAH
jgi:predicted TIM-barrel fold metal-dependent hydrolase